MSFPEGTRVNRRGAAPRQALFAPPVQQAEEEQLVSQTDQYVPTGAGIAMPELSGVYSKVIWRLMPFLFLAHVICAIDRLNISFAKLHMAQDIGLSDAAYGLGAGIFYLGYILFEVPSNLYLKRVGARATITRIMLLWGATSLGMAFITTTNQLVVARFLLGMAEAGFFPGVILYLTYWFPAALRGRITAVFLMAAMVAGVASGPLAGWIMTQYQGWAGLSGWQALFVLEGIPAVLLALFGWFWLTDKPERASWLTAQEKQAIAAALASENAQHNAEDSMLQGLREPRVYIAGIVYCCIFCGTTTMAYWMPTLISGFGMEDLRTVGMLSSLPYLLALPGMYWLGRSSDRRKERRWHIALAMLASSACFLLLSLAQGSPTLSVALMTVGAAAAMCAISLFWTLPPALLSPAAAVGGIAVINSIGNLAAVLTPGGVGALKSATGSLYLAFAVVAAIQVFGTIWLLLAIPARSLSERREAQ